MGTDAWRLILVISEGKLVKVQSAAEHGGILFGREEWRRVLVKCLVVA